MKQLTCEMCGSTDLLKQDGVFVCQSCGTKYSVEDAKKMMVEGTVEVTGTVKVDDSDELKNLLKLAKRSRENGDNKNAKNYYMRILEKEPSNWEAAFYSVYCTAMSTTLGQISNNAINVANCLDSIADLINQLPASEAENARFELTASVTNLATVFTSGISQKIEGGRDPKRSMEIVKNDEAAISTMKLKLGDVILQKFGDKDNAKTIYKSVITNELASIEIRNAAVKRMKIIDPSYQAPEIKEYNVSGGGCYVATAVYGSYDCPQVWTLRRFRDNTLAKTWYGRAFIHTYYAISPTLVKWFGETEWFKNMWQGKLDRMVAKLQADGVECTPYEDKVW